MKSSSDLRSMLKNIDRKGYSAYKGTYGIYDFGNYYLSIDHVQGDPFASPSKLSIEVKGIWKKWVIFYQQMWTGSFGTNCLYDQSFKWRYFYSF